MSPLKVYTVVKYTTTAPARPTYTISLDPGTLPTTTLQSSSSRDSANPLQFIAKHHPSLDISVEAWSFDGTTAHNLARADCDRFWNAFNNGTTGFKCLNKGIDYLDDFKKMRCWIVTEEAEKLVEGKTKKAWVFQLGKWKTVKGKEREEEQIVPKRKVWLWWDVVEVVEK
ncbi:hypothetical protein K458DRAFT_402814 [Lentithecium fluviatile CBS 122367]|uniref:Uncharacterized protein n=1 Tax=Lentithecium fluviatile CBS 122367 TaxID=1168545 RepID=A0A6G1J744_9PLEO|nr:hypothetical protein K458DRAFT_402814 [Lentithecium fluviatile CBS 122367]